MDYKITHFNDGKSKYESHEIKISITGDYSDIVTDINFPPSYGSSKEEAYEECIKQFKEVSDRIIDTLREMQQNLSIDKTIEVDCCGKVVE